MPRSRLVSCAVAAAIAATLAAAGCSSSSGGSGSTTPPNAAKLRAALLKSSDLPAGWKSTPHNPKDDKNNAATQAKMMTCLGAKNTKSDKVATANSPDFSQANMHVSSSASSYKSASDVASDAALFHNPKIEGCFQSLLKSELGPTLPKSLKLVGSTIHVDTNPSGPANEIAEINATVTVRAVDNTVPIYVRIAMIRGPLTEAQVQAENVLKPVPDSLMSKLTTAVAGRVQKL